MADHDVSYTVTIKDNPSNASTIESLKARLAGMQANLDKLGGNADEKLGKLSTSYKTIGSVAETTATTQIKAFSETTEKSMAYAKALDVVHEKAKGVQEAANQNVDALGKLTTGLGYVTRAISLYNFAREEDKKKALEFAAGLESVIQSLHGVNSVLSEGSKMWDVWRAKKALATAEKAADIADIARGVKTIGGFGSKGRMAAGAARMGMSGIGALGGVGGGAAGGGAAGGAAAGVLGGVATVAGAVVGGIALGGSAAYGIGNYFGGEEGHRNMYGQFTDSMNRQFGIGDAERAERGQKILSRQERDTQWEREDRFRGHGQRDRDQDRNFEIDRQMSRMGKSGLQADHAELNERIRQNAAKYADATRRNRGDAGTTSMNTAVAQEEMEKGAADQLAALKEMDGIIREQHRLRLEGAMKEVDAIKTTIAEKTKELELQKRIADEQEKAVAKSKQTIGGMDPLKAEQTRLALQTLKEGKEVNADQAALIQGVNSKAANAALSKQQEGKFKDRSAGGNFAFIDEDTAEASKNREAAGKTEIEIKEKTDILVRVEENVGKVLETLKPELDKLWLKIKEQENGMAQHARTKQAQARPNG